MIIGKKYTRAGADFGVPRSRRRLPRVYKVMATSGCRVRNVVCAATRLRSASKGAPFATLIASGLKFRSAVSGLENFDRKNFFQLPSLFAGVLEFCEEPAQKVSAVLKAFGTTFLPGALPCEVVGR